MSPPEHHRYGRARSQYGELFLPGGDGPFPVAVVLHGGFWRVQYGRKLMHPLCADLVARGWAAWNVEYRRLGRLSGGGFPRTLDDVAAAVDHLADLRSHALSATGDGVRGAKPPARGEPKAGQTLFRLERVVAIGHSAGGHLAAWLATREAPRVAVSGVAAQAGVVEPENALWQAVTTWLARAGDARSGR